EPKEDPFDRSILPPDARHQCASLIPGEKVRHIDVLFLFRGLPRRGIRDQLPRSTKLRLVRVRVKGGDNEPGRAMARGPESPLQTPWSVDISDRPSAISDAFARLCVAYF